MAIVRPIVRTAVRPVVHSATNKYFSWASWWSTLISATVEDAAPTDIILTFPSAETLLDASDFTVTVDGSAVVVNSASWDGAVLTLVLASAIVVGDTVIVTFVRSGGTVDVTNNVGENEVKTYITGLTLTSPVRAAINTFVKGLKSDLSISDLSTDFDGLYIRYNEHSASMLKNIARNSNHSTIHLMTGKKYIPFIGFSPCMTGYINTHLNIANETSRYTKDANAIGVYSLMDVTKKNWVEISIKPGEDSYVCILADYGASARAYYNNNKTTNVYLSNPSTTKGLLVNERSASNRSDYFINAISVKNNANVATDLIDQDFWEGVENSVGSPGTLFTGRIIALSFYGKNLGATAYGYIKSRFETYINTLINKNRQCVIEKGATYDELFADGVAAPAVCWDGTHYVMTISVWNDALNKWTCIFLTSSDLKIWTYITGSKTAAGPRNAGLCFYAGKYWFAYNDNPTIELAWSIDLLNWTLVDDDIIPGPGYDASINVNKDGNGLELWYVESVTRNIYMKTSSDGITWSSATKYKDNDTIYASDYFGQPSIFYIDGMRYMLCDVGTKNKDDVYTRMTVMMHSVLCDTTWIFDGPVLLPNPTADWESKQVFDSYPIIADLGDGLGNIPRILYAGSNNNSMTNDTDSCIGLFNLIMEDY